MNIRKGEIVYVNLNPVIGHEQGNKRPVLIIQNDIGNKYSPLTIVAPITSKIFEKEFPTNVFLPKEISKLSKDSTIMLNQIRTIDKKRIIKKLGTLNQDYIKKVNEAIIVSLDLKN